MRIVGPFVFLLSCFVVSARAEVQSVSGEARPAEIQAHLFVFSAEWAMRIPPSGSVNYPEFLTTLYPGQRIAVGLMATGIGHDALLKNVTIRARFTLAGQTAATPRELKPIALRQIKAEGADFALMALEAAGLSAEDRARTEAATAQQTLAIFVPDWSVPAVEESTEAAIAVDVSGAAKPVVIEPAKVRIKTTADWLKEPPPGSEEIGRRLNRYQGDLAPGQLLSWFLPMSRGRALREIPVHTFFALALRSYPAAREAVVAAYPDLSPDVQSALLWVLRLGGHAPARLFPELPAEKLAGLESVEPLTDPRQLPRFADPLDVSAVAQIGQAMDRCWAGWMVTGDQSYLRALVDLLGGADDYPVFKRWQETRAGAQGLNAQVARGLAYQIAGWSISSFQRSDPLVADWLLFWQKDSSVPANIRQEIASLSQNPVFRREDTRK